MGETRLRTGSRAVSRAVETLSLTAVFLGNEDRLGVRKSTGLFLPLLLTGRI
jgi:hypothetical protein